MPKGKKNRGKNKADDVDSSFVSSHHGAARGDYLFDPADLRRKPLSMDLVQRPPKRIQDSITWMEKANNVNLTLSTGGGVSELNLVGQLNAFPEASVMATLFDQYCIYSIFASARLEISNVPVSTETSFGRIYSAIDFDSNSNVGTEAAIQEFSTCIGSELVYGKSYERFCKPTIAMVTGGANSTSNTGVAMGRKWLNSNSNAVPHFCIRYLTVGNNTATAQNVSIIYYVVFGFRNSV